MPSLRGRPGALRLLVSIWAARYIHVVHPVPADMLQASRAIDIDRARLEGRKLSLSSASAIAAV